MVTEFGQSVSDFHDWLVWLITAICLFVLGAAARRSSAASTRSKNPVPSTTTHNTLLEVAWTVVPVLILVASRSPPSGSCAQQLVIPQADLVVKVDRLCLVLGLRISAADQGGGFKFDLEHASTPKDPRSPASRALLAVDNEMVVPVSKIVRVQVTAADVMHSFAMPSFGIKIDAIPGRLNETWFKAEREGIYYGQCSELCGNGHPYMPITIRVVSEEDYAAWLAEAKKKYASHRRPSGSTPARRRSIIR